MTRTITAVAALSLSLAIALGAVGAHAIGGEPAARELWRTASFWHTANSLGLLALAVLLPHLGRRLALTGVLAIGLGTLGFCGSIYVQALQGSAPVPILAPIGGSLQILGWLVVAVAALIGRARSADE